MRGGGRGGQAYKHLSLARKLDIRDKNGISPQGALWTHVDGFLGERMLFFGAGFLSGNTRDEGKLTGREEGKIVHTACVWMLFGCVCGVIPSIMDASLHLYFHVGASLSAGVGHTGRSCMQWEDMLNCFA